MKSIIGERRDLNLNVSIRNIRKNQMNYKVLGKKNHFINNKYCGILIKGHNNIYIYIYREREREREREIKEENSTIESLVSHWYYLVSQKENLGFKHTVPLIVNK